MKQKAILIILITSSFIVLLSGISPAITVTATPNPASVNQNVAVNIYTTFPAVRGINCTIEANFGDGSPWVDAGTCTASPCNLSASHIYTTTGTYTITAGSRGACSTPPDPPDPATTSITIQCTALNITSPSTLPAGTVGQAYTYQIQTSGGQPPIAYSLVSGSLPPGLTLGSTGLISGTPATAGSYSFTVRATDSCSTGAQTAEKTFSLTINPGAASVSADVTPSSLRIPRGMASTRSLLYSFSAIPAGDMTLTSPRGVFRAGGNVIGEVNTPLNVSVINGTGRVSEVLIIPVAITKRAERLGTARVTYTRTFSNTELSVTAQPEIVVTTEAAAEFSITRLQLYFENRRAEITVKRNQPLLKAYADIRFTGSGLLQGYWEVDGRILSNVNQHLVYGRTVTIQSPDIPALPTFDPGAHRVRFVITSPKEEIPLPEAVYFVRAEEFRKKLPIKLVFPDNASELAYSPPGFRWRAGDATVVYLIEFYEEGGRKPVFSAYTRGTDYSLPPVVLKRVFSPGKVYLWRVKGFDTENDVAGESPVYRFSFKEIASHLPGQIVMVTRDSRRGAALIQHIEDKYSLHLLETFDIKSLGLKVTVFQAGEDIFGLINAIAKEEGVVLVQPNHIFRTQQEPLSRMQNIYRILNLRRLHEYFRGRGVMVAVIDTGVDTGHRDLRERISASVNLLKDHPYRPEIHGTAVAGIIGAGINGFGIVGVAPEAEILALRACRQVSELQPEGECYTTSITKAIDTAISRKSRIVNMSFGSTVPDELLSRLIEEGAKKGVLFVAPVGNMPDQRGLSFPASHPDVIAVGGIDDRGSPFPNPEIASKAVVSAPATNVFTTIPGNRHNFLSGTSMASATVTGILALAAGKDRSMDRHNLPSFNGDICKWQERLLEVSVCER